MARRFQFSLRALLVAVAVVASLLSGYAYSRNYDNWIGIDQVAEGQPVRIRLCFFRPFWTGNHFLGLVVNGHDYNWVDNLDLERSWGVFWQAETAMALPPPGDYYAFTLPSTDLDTADVGQVFVVEPRE